MKESEKIMKEIGTILIKSNLTKIEIFGVLEGIKAYFVYEYIEEHKSKRKKDE